VRALASIQETMLDVDWISDGVVCIGTRSAERCYRAALVVEGPPEAFAPEPERAEPPLNAFANFLNALAHPLQAVVLPEPATLDSYAAQLEKRAALLPPGLAAQARADAAWARQEGPRLGLLDRRGYVVVPAEDIPSADLLRRLWAASSRFSWRSRGEPHLDAASARERLDDRCASLVERLARGGVWSQRLDDPGLARLFHTCWSAWSSCPGLALTDRFDHDLRTCLAPAAERSL